MTNREPRRKPVFEVDKKGLAKLLERRGKQFALLELWQNAADEDGVTKVDMILEASTDGNYDLVVEDDAPEGFADIAHAYTLFAESAKKGRADQRGRFNLGEKLVIAICSWVQIATTKGLVEFTDDGRREYDTPKRKAGSRFHATLPMTHDEAQAAEEAVEQLIIPEGVTTTFNGRQLERREPVHVFEVSLRTELADAEGYLRPTRRKTEVAVYDPRPNETAAIYEMGIPVVETGDRWHVDIGQKVPLTTDRDNVPPGYLRDVRAAVLNNCAALLDDASGKWIDDALEDETIEPQAVQAAVTGRYGDEVVIDDPSDREGTKIAVSKGMTVIPAGAFTKGGWKAVKETGAALPAGQVTPSPKHDTPDGELKLLDPEHWTEGVRVVADYAKAIAPHLIPGCDSIEVRVENDPQASHAAAYGPRNGGSSGMLTLNYGRLGYTWFKDGRTSRVDELLIHEFAHHIAPDHLHESFHDECCRLGAALTQLALDEPDLLVGFEAGAVVA
jgi:hypothetical protein